MFYTGASSDWPAERIERLWLKTLPDVDVATLFSTDPDVKVIQQSGKFSEDRLCSLRLYVFSKQIYKMFDIVSHYSKTKP